MATTDRPREEQKLATFLQLLLNGVAVGCIYGLVALGFVLIYKATELVNFAQGDLLMLGAFVAYMAVVWWGWDYWLGFGLGVVVVAAFGAVLDRTILRKVIGQPQFAVVMLTIGLGAMFRTFASITWGSEPYTMPTPFSGVTVIAGVTLSDQYLSIIVGTLLLCGTLYAFFNHTRIGVAMQATSQNQLAAYYMGIPVKLIFSLIWAISAATAAIAGVLLAPVTLIDINMGLAVALKAFAAAVLGGFGSIPGALVGGIIIGLIELFAGRFLPDGFKDAAPYVVLLVMLAVRPQGLFGSLGRKKVYGVRPMRFQFKTSYNQDIGLFRDRVDMFWYGLLAVAVVVLPLLMSTYYVTEISLVLIYGICGISLMVLVGFTGLVSLGHAAFLGIGAYAHGYFLKIGIPWIPSVGMAVAITTACGLIVGLPALRMTGIYLTIATLAFSLIIQEVFNRWTTVTHGFDGLPVAMPEIFNVTLGKTAFYYLCLFFLVLCLWLTRNLLRSPTGRAWVAIRDSEIAAQSMGVHLAIYKSFAFAYSAGLMGLAGALYAHKISHLAPDIFNILLSINFLLLVIVGGLGSLHGTIFGAFFVVLLPPIISILRDEIPAGFSDAAAATGIGAIGAIGKAIGAFLSKPGVEAGILGLILVLVILLEPLGMYGRWVKIRVFFSTFPMYKRATFKRQKSYMKSERLR